MHNGGVDLDWQTLIGSLFRKRPPVAEEKPRERRRASRLGSGDEVKLEWFGLDGEVAEATAVLRDGTEDGFCVSTGAKVQVGMTLWMEKPGSPPLKSIVRHVREEEGKFVAGMQRISRERRREDRTPANGTATLRHTGPHGETLCYDVLVRNVASEGVQVSVPKAVPTNEVARLITPAVECTGTMRYCIPGNDAFLVGLFFVGGVRPGEAGDPVDGLPKSAPDSYSSEIN